VAVATIRKRVYGSGQVGYQAVIRLKRGGAIVHQESRAFSRAALAKEWATAREAELQKPGALDALKAPAPAALRLSKLIADYRKDFEKIGKWGRTKGSALKALEGMAVASLDASKLTSDALVAHVRTRRLEGAGPATAGQDLIWIGVVLKAAKGASGLPVNPHVVEDARETCRGLRLIGRAKRRDRRPTDDELTKLYERWRRADGRSKTPMEDIVRFAISSARRQEEITRLRWDDLDEATHTILVRDVKHPTSKDGNHRRAKLTDEALQIIQRQPRTGERIFPYTTDAIGSSFTRSCAVLGIKDLHFHDLRHEGTSRLFEAGYQIHEVAQFTLHESWTELKRYTQLRPENMKLR
jgi:integrase